MAMPPRLVKRRGAGHRWLVIPLVLTILVVLMDASMHARSDSQQVALDRGQWVDQVLPQIAASSTQGLEIAELASSPLAEGSRAAVAQLDSIARAARGTYQAVTKQGPPASLAVGAGLLEACLSARQSGAQEMAAAATLVLDRGQRAATEAVSDMGQAVYDFQVSDRAYRLFRSHTPGTGVTMPPSQWALPSAHYSARTYAAFATHLSAEATKAPRYQLTIDAVTTAPMALSMQGNEQVLPPAPTLTVTVVVSDTGTSAERGVTVAVALAPSHLASGAQRSVRVDLTAGSARTVSLRGLVMVRSTPSVLTVKASGPGGPSASSSRALNLEMAGTDFDQVTTTTVTTKTSTTLTGPSSTTAPGEDNATTTTPTGASG